MKKGLLILVMAGCALMGQAQAWLHRAAVDGRVDSVRNAVNLPQEYTGEGVIIGITDWGFDYTHPVFYDTTMTRYRVLRAWDQFKTSGPAPDGYDYGTEYVGETSLLNAQCDTSNVYDYAYHGTHCAGIAGGSGAGTKYRGVAVEAEYLFVTVILSKQAVIDAWRWMYEVAQQEGKRLVISMSWGLYYLDNMDGTGALAEEIQRLNDLGVVFVSSAGNNGDEKFHLSNTFTQSDTIHTAFSFPASSIGSTITMMNSESQPFSFSLFVMDNSFEVIAETPFYGAADAGVTDSFLLVNGDTLRYWCEIDPSNVYNHKQVVQLQVFKSGSYRCGLAVAATGGTFHAWNLALIETNYGNWGGAFTRPGAHPDWLEGDKLYGISTPANVDCVITVAAHSSRYTATSGAHIGGQIASFSSYGPGFGQVTKPDISAPGVNVTSSLSSFTNTYSGIAQTSVEFNGRTYKFVSLSGTSMACPFVAGVAALLLQANPYLSASQVKEILLETAYQDQYTESAGVLRFGNGKVNAYQAILRALTTVGVDEYATPQEPLFTVFPNPASGQCFVTANTDGSPAFCQIVDLSGRAVLQTTLEPGVNSLNLSNISPGCYVMRIADHKTVTTKKLIINR